MQNTIPLCNVTIFGALGPEGETYRRCRIAMNGKPASVVLYTMLEDERRWKSADTLSDATITENHDGSLVIEGTSRELIETVGVAAKDAIVRWEVETLPCRNCN